MQTMYVWRITIRDHLESGHDFATYLGTQANAEMAMHDAVALALGDGATNPQVAKVECLGEADF